MTNDRKTTTEHVTRLLLREESATESLFQKWISKIISLF